MEKTAQFLGRWLIEPFGPRRFCFLGVREFCLPLTVHLLENDPITSGRVSQTDDGLREFEANQPVEIGLGEHGRERGGGRLLEVSVRNILQRNERVPRREDRVWRGLGLVQKIAPAPDGEWNEILVGEELIEAFLRVVVQLKLGGEIVANSRTEARVGLVAALGNLVGKLPPLVRKFLVLRGCQRNESVIRPVKDSVERVVVPRRNGIVFVIVATGACHRQSHRAARHHVDAIINDVMRDTEKTPSASDETHRREIG